MSKIIKFPLESPYGTFTPHSLDKFLFKSQAIIGGGFSGKDHMTMLELNIEKCSNKHPTPITNHITLTHRLKESSSLKVTKEFDGLLDMFSYINTLPKVLVGFHSLDPGIDLDKRVPAELTWREGNEPCVGVSFGYDMGTKWFRSDEDGGSSALWYMIGLLSCNEFDLWEGQTPNPFVVG